MSIRFDHFITYTSAASIEDHLQEYKAQGFASDEKTVRHDPGLRNGFVWLGAEYIEFCWVEDETLFAEKGEDERMYREKPRPFGIGLLSTDVQAVHDEWVARGYSVPDVWSKAPRDADQDTPPVWSFQEIPEELLPGASCFALTYHRRQAGAVRQIRIPANTVYALSGVTFVNPDAEKRALTWRDLLAPGEQVRQSTPGFEVRIGPHQAQWMTPDAYQATYQLEWKPAGHANGDIALLHLLATDHGIVKEWMQRSGRRCFPVDTGEGEQLMIEPHLRDGFTFLIKQRAAQTWLQERSALTGEKLELIQNGK